MQQQHPFQFHQSLQNQHFHQQDMAPVPEMAPDHSSSFSSLQQQHQQVQLQQQQQPPPLPQQSQSTPQLQTLQNRARSTSESQRALRAEKRMGRLFRQQSSSAIHSSSSTSTPASASISHTKQLSLDQPSFSSSSFASASASSSATNLDQDDSLSPKDINQDNTFVHSNNSSISSQVGSSTSSSTTPSISSNQTTRKFGFPTISVNTSVPNSSTLISASTTASISVSSPEIMSPNMYSNISLSTINSNDTNNSTSIQQLEDTKFKFRSDPSFSKLSTLSENINMNGKLDISLDTLLLMSKKFVFFHNQFLITLESLSVNINLSITNFNVYLAVLETVEKKLIQKGHDQITDSMKAHLTLSLINSMSDLKKFIENLKLYFKSNNLDTPLSSLRMTYFNLFSLFIELTNICKIMVPLSNRSALTSNPSSINIHTNSLRSNSIIQKNKQNIIINRIPAPNPQLSSQSISTQGISSESITNRQPSLSRQHSKLDRQDSDLSISSNAVDYSATSTEELYDLIGHTVQAAHVVYNQMNSAIAKSAILISENRTLDPNNNNSNNQDSEKSNNISNIVIKVKELTNQCLASMEQTKKVENCLAIVKNSSQIDSETQKNLYEQTNLFLKSIISILAATKMAIQDMPALNEVRSSLSILTRATKELTIKLESSSLKQAVLNNVPSTTTDQPNLLSIPSMGNFNFDQQQIQSPILQQQLESNTIRRVNKLRQIPEHNEHMIGTMKQHIKNLEINTSDIMNQPPLAVTTPLIASIGPAVANAVLPMKSPLKTSSANLSATFMSNAINQQTTIDGNLQNGGATTPLYFTGDGNIQNEYNPFDRLLVSRNVSGQ